MSEGSDNSEVKKLLTTSAVNELLRNLVTQDGVCKEVCEGPFDTLSIGCDRVSVRDLEHFGEIHPLNMTCRPNLVAIERIRLRKTALGARESMKCGINSGGSSDLNRK